MIIFVDDSGDPGFKLGQGSSEYFAIAAVYFANNTDAKFVRQCILELRQSLNRPSLREFKFSRTSSKVKQEFFGRVRQLPFQAKVSIVDKMNSPHVILCKNASDFYNRTILETLKNIPKIDNLWIFLDGEGGMSYRKKVKTFFRQSLEKSTVQKLVYTDSQDEPLIQLADMIAGAALAKHSKKKEHYPDYLKVLGRRVDISDL